MTFSEKLKLLIAKATGSTGLRHAELEYAEYELREFLADHASAIVAVASAMEKIAETAANNERIQLSVGNKDGAGAWRHCANTATAALSALNRAGGDDER